ncbi:hypothetical protein [Neptuniibacter sp.]|uniref:hypothetical protein n=1 Tax=Neptuniibacter sp. TaxID=1962643 RepID=UPI00260F2BAA|nr:hypothetical protein [Neptuniibacter sp.]MCP4597815.1 hypothetical protein [Neptuniibacter sp.]
MSIELLPADLKHPKEWHIRTNSCRCHPETCCCDDWALYSPDGEKASTFFDETEAEKEAEFRNQNA